MIRIWLGLCVAAVASVGVTAQTAPPPAKPAPALPPIAGVSAAGMAIVDKARGPSDTGLAPLVRAQRLAHQQVVAASIASPILVDALAAAIKKEEAAQAVVRAHLNDQMIGVLRELPEADRAPFVRSLVKPVAVAPAKP